MTMTFRGMISADSRWIGGCVAISMFISLWHIGGFTPALLYMRIYEQQERKTRGVRLVTGGILRKRYIRSADERSRVAGAFSPEQMLHVVH